MARFRKVLTAGALGAATFALIATAAGTTGAFFSEAQDGGVTGTMGAVHLSTSSTTIAWTNMMPGEQKSSAVDFRNTGTGPQDFYLVFPNRSALHALNNLGSYGEVHVTGGKTGQIVPLFDSKNLQDGRHATATHPELGYNSCGNVFTPTGCWPVPTQLKLASNVAVNATGSFSFGFTYDGRIGNGTSGGAGAFNSYPLTSALDANDPLDRVGTTGDNGLPFKVVAVQVGQQP